MESYLFDNMARTETDHWWFRGRSAIVMALIDRLGVHDGLILDVGAGTGATTIRLRRFGEVEALELAEPALVYLRAVPDLLVHDRPLPDPSLASERYDLITAFDVLEHLPEDGPVMGDVQRLLKPGGWFVCTVPAHPALWSLHDDHHHHRRRYTRRGLVGLLRGSGLTVTFCSYWLTLLFPVFLVHRTLSWLRPPGDAAVSVPAPWLNRLLGTLLAVERHWLARGVGSPMGASLLAVARRDA